MDLSTISHALLAPDAPPKPPKKDDSPPTQDEDRDLRAEYGLYTSVAPQDGRKARAIRNQEFESNSNKHRFYQRSTIRKHWNKIPDTHGKNRLPERLDAIFRTFGAEWASQSERYNRTAPFQVKIKRKGNARVVRFHHAGDAVAKALEAVRMAPEAVLQGDLEVRVQFRNRGIDADKFNAKVTINHMEDYGLRPFIDRFKASCKGTLLSLPRKDRPALRGYSEVYAS